ncbi:exo84 subunit/exocyst complex component [Desarmillaria tabescens]|uniref:Exocyst complex component EXO84 n=1 Tax=Armillaria tabescens TaxID=1929756 RepID=A0AA39TTS1_ARMTA|nr:exo84 subunit/exocyst complex component [Desarmillaria tabescens]KAK0466198.1 exo84 subunit/exocyst complex component [Desarmillaria tabescens]
MQSLRTRRSQAPARKVQRSGTKLSKIAQGVTPRPRDARKSRVDDKIKKRMSMRYADISGPTELNVPPMPSIPTVGVITDGFQNEVVGEKIGTRDDGAAVAAENDKKLLDKDDFDPDAYLKLKLANSTEAEVKSLQSSLRGAKDDTATDLQKNVFQNYAEFVLISKEISTLENEMIELKESLSEYKSMPSLLHIPDPTSTSSSTMTSYRRSSVADLRIMYFNQMQALHTQIEGSAKFAPTTPGRHVVGEVEGVLSLNAATYKVVGKVKFVVLDDAVLVARRRRRNGGPDSRSGGSVSEGKLVAERCWPLSEMLVLDTKDSPSMTNVFKIRHGKETHVYRTESPADKKSLLQQLRHVAEELAAKKRKEREGEHERRKSLWQGAGHLDTMRNCMPQTEWMRELAAKAGEAPGVDAKEKLERDARWTSEWADDLTVAIALREWEKATRLVEEGKAKLAAVPPLAPKLPGLTSQLIAALLSSLSLVSNKKSTVISLISLLLRLNAGPAARATFLKMRTQVIKNFVRKIKFEGHIGTYIADLAIVTFTAIKHTADWFLASFKENEVASAFIDWAKSQIENYADVFRRQVFSSDVDPKVVEEALKITYSQSKKLLEDYGLDFRFLLEELLAENVQESETTTKPAKLDLQDIRITAPKLSKSSSKLSHSLTSSVSRRSPTPSASSAMTQSSSSTSSGATTTAAGATPTALSSAPPSGYSSASFYTPTPATGMFPPSQTQMPPVPALRRARTPLSSAMPTYGTSTPPLSAPVPPVPLASPLPRRTRSPPPSASPLRPGTSNSIRDRPPRSAKASPAPPPRSTNRPGSSAGHRPPPVAVPSREGMI